MIDHRSSRGGAGIALLLATVLAAPPLRAQSPSGYTELITSDITSRTASAELTRTLVREIEWRRSARGDTVVMQAVRIRLEERSDAGTWRHDTDGVTGARWLLLPGDDGRWRVVERPFVPPELVEVNDLAAAMDDFFPPAPPLLSRDGRIRDGAGRAWQRLADSAALPGYRWESRRTRDTTAIVRDTVPLRIEEAIEESSRLRVDARGEPVGWLRVITTEVLSRGAGRGVRATVRQRIEVATRP